MAQLQALPPADPAMFEAVTVPELVSEGGKLLPETVEEIRHMIAQSATIFEILASTKFVPVSSQTGKNKKQQPFYKRLEKIAKDKAGPENPDRARGLAEEMKMGIWFILAGHMLANKGLRVEEDDTQTAENLRPVLDQVMQAINRLPHAEFIEDLCVRNFLAVYTKGTGNPSPAEIIDKGVLTFERTEFQILLDVMREPALGRITQGRLAVELISKAKEVYGSAFTEALQSSPETSFTALAKDLIKAKRNFDQEQDKPAVVKKHENRKYEDKKSLKERLSPAKWRLEAAGDLQTLKAPPHIIYQIICLLESDDYENRESELIELLDTNVKLKLAYRAGKARAKIFPASGVTRLYPWLRNIPGYLKFATHPRLSGVPLVTRGFTRSIKAREDSGAKGDSNSYWDRLVSDVSSGIADNLEPARLSKAGAKVKKPAREALRAELDKFIDTVRASENYQAVFEDRIREAMLATWDQLLAFVPSEEFVESALKIKDLPKKKQRKQRTRELARELSLMMVGPTAHAELAAAIDELKTELGPQTQGITATAQAYLKGESTALRSNLNMIIGGQEFFQQARTFESRINYIEADIALLEELKTDYEPGLVMARIEALRSELEESKSGAELGLSRSLEEQARIVEVEAYYAGVVESPVAEKGQDNSNLREKWDKAKKDLDSKGEETGRFKSAIENYSALLERLDAAEDQALKS